ncbi:hypothetical protein L6Q96_09995 [Candidatus Binatia bacterium]|nr:hypothetical protein [Candidatus Binatia bacterium]
MLLVVNPTSGAPAAATSLRGVVDGLAGRTVGFFSNNKPNAAAVLERIEELLTARFGIVGRRYVKFVPSLAADAGLLDEIARDCDAAVVAGFD